MSYICGCGTSQTLRADKGGWCPRASRMFRVQGCLFHDHRAQTGLEETRMGKKTLLFFEELDDALHIVCFFRPPEKTQIGGSFVHCGRKRCPYAFSTRAEAQSHVQSDHRDICQSHLVHNYKIYSLDEDNSTTTTAWHFDTSSEASRFLTHNQLDRTFSLSQESKMSSDNRYVYVCASFGLACPARFVVERRKLCACAVDDHSSLGICNMTEETVALAGCFLHDHDTETTSASSSAIVDEAANTPTAKELQRHVRHEYTEFPSTKHPCEHCFMVFYKTSDLSKHVCFIK